MNLQNKSVMQNSYDSFMGNIDKMRAFSKNQLKVKGFYIIAPTNISTPSIELSGLAKFFLGLTVSHFETNRDTSFVNLSNMFVRYVVNNDVILDNMCMLELNSDYNNNQHTYFEFPRPLNGSDSFRFEIQNLNGASKNLTLNFFYL